MNHRNDFSAATRRILALRVGYLCSNPTCRATTTGSTEGTPHGVVNIGVAAHITAASLGGPRFDSSLTAEERAAADNGIWLCQVHAKEIDDDPLRFTASVLRDWKHRSETDARNNIGKAVVPSPEDDSLPIYMPSLEPTERGRFSFATRFIPFVGRVRELGVITAFINNPSDFSWLVVSGPAGSGKSRLLLEVCHSIKTEWRAGFVERGATGFSWNGWHPTRPTLLVLDYASTQVSLVREIVSALSREPALARPVRLVLIDRVADDAWERKVFGAGSDLHMALATRFPALIALDLLSDDEAGELLKHVLNASGADHDVTQFWDGLPEWNRLPLFAAMTAFSIAEGHSPRGLRSEVLMHDWLHREREMYWMPNGVTESEIRLLCLANIVGDISAEFALSGDLASCGIQSDEIRPKRYQALCGSVPWSSFSPLAPDILGEFMVLETIEERHPKSLAMRSLLQTAWEYDPDQTAGFLTRISQDFPTHDVSTFVLGFIPSDTATEEWSFQPARLSLSSMWSEAASFFLPNMFHFAETDTVVSLLALVAKTPIAHADLIELRKVYGDALFDDPLSYSGQLMYYPASKNSWHYGYARDLGLRLSDIRSRHSHNMAQFIRHWCEVEKTSQVSRALSAAAQLLENHWEDRVVRVPLAWALSDGMVLMLRHGVEIVAREAWAAIERCYSAWCELKHGIIDANIPKSESSLEPLSANEERGAGETSSSERQTKTEQRDRVVSERIDSYDVFVQEFSDEGEIVDIFARATVNFIMAYPRVDIDRNTETSRMFNALEEMCVVHNGQYDLAVRLMEAGGLLVEDMVAQGRTAEADTITSRLKHIASEYAQDSEEVYLGMISAQTAAIQGYIRAGNLVHARQIFDEAKCVFGIPDNIKAGLMRHVIATIVNLSSAALQAGDERHHSQLIELLLEVRRHAKEQDDQVIRGLFTVWRNELVVRLKNADESHTKRILGTMASEFEVSNSVENALMCVSACLICAVDNALTSVHEIVGEIVCMVLAHAQHAREARGWPEVFDLSQQIASLVGTQYPGVAVEILEAYKSLAIARFRGGQELATRIDATIDSLRDQTST